MAFDVTIAHSVEAVGAEAWDHLSGGRPFASYRWYRFGEAVMAEATPLYVTLASGGEPVARAAFWLTWQEPLPVTAPAARRAVDALLRRWPLMVCRSPLAGWSGLILPDPPLRDPALRALLQVAQAEARRRRASFLIFDYLEQDDLAWAAWPDSAFAPLSFADAGTRLPITWPDFDSYLEHLSRKTRKSYRRNCKQAEEMGLSVTEHAAVTDVDDAVALIRNVEKQHGSPPNPWVRGMLTHADMVPSVWLRAAAGGRLVGCELMLGDGGAWFLTALGRDYDVPVVYFMLGYADIRRAIAEGAHVLRWGSGAYEAKLRLGFELETNHHTMITAPNRALRWLVRRLAALGPAL